jgi:hypothetical protein
VKTDLLKYAMYGNIVVMLLIIGQAMTGLGRSDYTFEGWIPVLVSSHEYTGHLGLMLTLGILVLVIISKHDGKLKGMSIGLFAMWVMQFGLGEMMGAGKTWLGMVHAPLAVMMFAHAAMMMNKFKEAIE